MPTATINNRTTVDGRTYTRATTMAADGTVLKEKTALAAAKVGALTTRTDANTGELTMASGHGITTGQRLDVYWDVGGTKGHRRGMTVGTVASLAVPIDGGVGDDLPADESAITACVPTEEEFLVTGNNAQYILAKASRRGLIVFADSGDVELAAVTTELEGSTGGGYQWYTGNGVTNPLAGDAVAKVFFSNGDSAGTNAMVATVGVN